MTTQTAMIDYDAEFNRIAKETSKSLIETSGNYISTKGKLFNFDGSQCSNFNCVVLDFIIVNQLLPPYNPSTRNTPKCWAIGRTEDTLAPSEKSIQKQADLCKTCGKNQYGSATNGTNGKACKNSYRLAVVPDTAEADSNIWFVTVSPTGIKAWNNYVKNTHAYGGYLRVVTNLSFNPNVDYPSLLFKYVSKIEKPETILALRKRACEEIMIEPRTD